MEQALQKLAQHIQKENRVVAFTGSGISAESGIPTFRGKGGIWKKYRPSLYGNIPGLFLAYLLSPSRIHAFSLEAFSTFLTAEPNPAHKALADFESMRILRSIITQNIDDLHERAGSRWVIKLHGDLYRLRCLGCGMQRPVSREEFTLIMHTLKKAEPTRIGLIRVFRNLLPRCSTCRRRTRPDVVFFGESLPADDFSHANTEARNCDIMLVVGTSGLVYPAASIPFKAKRRGALIAEFSLEPSEITKIADFYFQGPAGDSLTKLLTLVA